ncbi:hypothetical protein ACIA8K_29855 [Catenuloplanes sp. NPDC051500]|uniref:hypothetical protein n=1 Tax=Catenuloplanes sp. NPDC051500 TaxID=3363959 RepID=UPI00378844B3
MTIASHPEGHHLLVDLERLGALTITGDPQRAADMLRYLAAELATSTWSDDTDIILTGLPATDVRDLTALAGSRIRSMAAVQAANRLENQDTHASAALRIAARLTGAGEDPPTPVVVLAAGPDSAEAIGLPSSVTGAQAVAAAQRTGTPFGLHLDVNGTVTLDWLDTTGLVATGLPADQLANLARFFRTARTNRPSPSPSATPPTDEPVPPATEEWAEGTDAHGHLLPRNETHPQTTTPQEAVRAGVPAAGVESHRRRSSQDDPELDADLDSWHDPATARLRIAILGPVDVLAAGPPPEERLRFHREIVVYLAQRGRHGATGEQLDAALWPETIVSPRSRRVAMSRTRRWLGETPDGEPWLPPNNSVERTYRLNDGFLLDWHLFRRLRTRAELTGSDGITDLRKALELVRGKPLAGADLAYAARYRIPYAWLPDSNIQPHHLTSAIVDTVHQYVGLCLSTGDLAGARWAVDIAWQADQERAEDHPWLDAMRIAYQAGHRTEVRTLLDDLVQARDAEVPEDLTAATYRQIITLMPEIVSAG